MVDSRVIGELLSAMGKGKEKHLDRAICELVSRASEAERWPPSVLWI